MMITEYVFIGFRFLCFLQETAPRVSEEALSNRAKTSMSAIFWWICQLNRTASSWRERTATALKIAGWKHFDRKSGPEEPDDPLKFSRAIRRFSCKYR